jgi:hypothetical protein
MTNTILAAIIGLLAGLAWCYYKQLQTAYNNRGLIGDVSTITTAGQDIWNKI